jgi:DNA-binding XRE family transcriptional regulator
MNNLSRFRKLAKLTQRQVAERAQCTEQTVRKIEYGWRTPRVDLAVRLARAVGATVEAVFPAADAECEERRVQSE